MGDSIHVFRFGDLTVQSHLDERTTRRLFEYVRDNGLMGRTTPPRKGFLGMAGKLLWKKKFEYAGRHYVVEGGGKQIAIYEELDAEEIDRSAGEYRECRVCGLAHPDSDLVETPDGPVCRPCHDARFPTCVRCGRRVELTDDQIPAENPFVCESCRAASAP